MIFTVTISGVGNQVTTQPPGLIVKSPDTYQSGLGKMGEVRGGSRTVFMGEDHRGVWVVWNMPKDKGMAFPRNFF